MSHGRNRRCLLTDSCCLLLVILLVPGCDPCLNNPCDDGIACNGQEACAVDGEGFTCSDGVRVQCSAPMVCREPDGICVSDGSDPCAGNPCDDGLACNGIEVCISDGFEAVCTDGIPITCGQGILCQEPNGTCPGSCSGNPCDDGLFCNGTETCVGGECGSGTPPCAEGETCDENNDECPSGGSCYTPGQPVTRTVPIKPPSGTLVYGVEDTPPAGWTVSDISDDGEYDAGNNAVKWFFLDDLSRTLTYTTHPLNETTGRQCFNGLVNYDGGANLSTLSLCLEQCSSSGCASDSECSDGQVCQAGSCTNPTTGNLSVWVDPPAADLEVDPDDEAVLGVGTVLQCRVTDSSYDPFQLTYSWSYVSGPLGGEVEILSPPPGLSTTQPVPLESFADVGVRRNANGVFAAGTYVFECAVSSPAGETADATGSVTLYTDGAPEPPLDPSLSAPTLTAPPDGSFKWPTALLQWTAVDGAALYNFQVSGSPSFPGFAAVGTTPGTSYTLDLTIYVVPGPFYWRVRAQSGLGVGPWSDT